MGTLTEFSGLSDTDANRTPTLQMPTFGGLSYDSSGSSSAFSYVTKNGVTPYVAEDGVTLYVTEAAA